MSRSNPITPANTDEYIAMQPEEFQPVLNRLRSIILSEAPQATESISYQVPCFKYLYMLVGIGVNKNYCSLYTMNPTLAKELKKEIKGLKVSGATIHFPPGEPLPVELIKRIVATRMKQNESLALAKK